MTERKVRRFDKDGRTDLLPSGTAAGTTKIARFFFAPCRFGGLCLSNTGHGAIIPSRCVLFGSRFSGLVGRDFFGDRRIALQGDDEQACNDRHHCCNAHRELIAVLLDQDG